MRRHVISREFFVRRSSAQMQNEVCLSLNLLQGLNYRQADYRTLEYGENLMSSYTTLWGDIMEDHVSYVYRYNKFDTCPSLELVPGGPCLFSCIIGWGLSCGEHASMCSFLSSQVLQFL
jgi:hypothetical protein